MSVQEAHRRNLASAAWGLRSLTPRTQHPSQAPQPSTPFPQGRSLESPSEVDWKMDTLRHRRWHQTGVGAGRGGEKGANEPGGRRTGIRRRRGRRGEPGSVGRAGERGQQRGDRGSRGRVRLRSPLPGGGAGMISSVHHNQLP